MERLTNVDSLSSLRGLKSIHFEQNTALRSIVVVGQLTELRDATVDQCPLLVDLPEKWPVSLKELNLQHVKAPSIGKLPVGFEQDSIDLSTLQELHDLSFMDECINIKEARLCLSALQRIPDYKQLGAWPDRWITIDMEEQDAIPDIVIKRLSKLPTCRIRIDNYQCKTKSNRPLNLSNLANIPELKALDLDEDYYYITAKELLPVIGFERLEYLQFPSGSLPEFGGCTFDTPGKVAKLKMQLLAS